MPHILQNKDLEIQIDLPTENYKHTRFDWTGKITTLKFRGKYLSGVEIARSATDPSCGKGFYNEFGIDSPLGYPEAQPGDLFHKIGVGLLKKEDLNSYDFQKNYPLIPARFTHTITPDSIRINCQVPPVNGYSYYLEKEIKLTDDGFTIHYLLKNTGEKPIITNEYNHNFLCIDKNLIDKHYTLKFPFPLQTRQFEETVNPEGIVNPGANDFTFNGTPSQQFFFSNLSGGAQVPAAWILENNKSKIGITETGTFQTNKVNLWGWQQVISPELFFTINIKAGQSTEWSRRYRVYEMKE